MSPTKPAPRRETVETKPKARSAKTTKPKAKAALSSGRVSRAFGDLPEWDLADLYPSMDGPEISRDLAEGLAKSAAFESEYKGKLDGLARRPRGAGALLAKAIAAYEEIGQTLERIGSYA